MSLDQPHRRAPHPPSLHRHDAVAVARPYNELVARWQRRIAHLRSLAAHKRSAEQRQQLKNEVAALIGEVRLRQAALSAAVTGLPPEVATNSILGDTRRAIESAATALNDVRAMLAEPPTASLN